MYRKLKILGLVIIAIGIVILGIAIYNLNSALAQCAAELGQSCAWIAAPYANTATQETIDEVEFLIGLLASIFGTIITYLA